MRNRVSAVLLPAAAGALVLSNTASAAVDVSAVVTEINGAVAPIGAIGAAVLLVVVAIKTFKWVRRAF